MEREMMVEVTNKIWPGARLLVPVSELRKGTEHLLNLLAADYERRQAASDVERARAGATR